MSLCKGFEYGIKTNVIYKADNNDVCGIVGTGQVCLIAGIRHGNTNVTATLLDANGSVLGTCEAAVIVDSYIPNVNTISAGSSVLNMNVGDKQTFDVSLSGPDIKSTDDRLIKWSSSDTVELLPL